MLCMYLGELKSMSYLLQWLSLKFLNLCFHCQLPYQLDKPVLWQWQKVIETWQALDHNMTFIICWIDLLFLSPSFCKHWAWSFFLCLWVRKFSFFLSCCSPLPSSYNVQTSNCSLRKLPSLYLIRGKVFIIVQKWKN